MVLDAVRLACSGFDATSYYTYTSCKDKICPIGLYLVYSLHEFTIRFKRFSLHMCSLYGRIEFAGQSMAVVLSSVYNCDIAVPIQELEVQTNRY